MSTHVRVWRHPGSYFGYNPEGHIIAAVKHRESSILDESNYAITSQRLLAIAMRSSWWMKPQIPQLENMAHDGPFSRFNPDETPLLYTFTASCSLVGWIEYLMIRPCAAARELINESRRINEALEAYCVLSDEDYSERQVEAIGEYWRTESLRGRIDDCRRYGESIFAARHDHPPDRVYDGLSNEAFA